MSFDLLSEERRMVSSVLALFETLLARLNTGEALPNAMLGDILDFFRAVEEEADEAGTAGGRHISVSEGVAHQETAFTLLRDMFWALESLQDGEAGAAGAFVMSSRRYIRACRDRLREDDLAARTWHDLAMRRGLDRVIDRYNRLRRYDIGPEG